MENIKDLLKQNKATLIDVRNDWEFSEHHLDGALNIPLDQIPARLNDFKQMKAPFILYCRSGSRSNMATSILKQAGISDVFNGGGISDLQRIILN